MIPAELNSLSTAAMAGNEGYCAILLATRTRIPESNEVKVWISRQKVTSLQRKSNS